VAPWKNDNFHCLEFLFAGGAADGIADGTGSLLACILSSSQVRCYFRVGDIAVLWVHGVVVGLEMDPLHDT
jgi:hypothetical protein